MYSEIHPESQQALVLHEGGETKAEHPTFQTRNLSFSLMVMIVQNGRTKPRLSF